MACAASPIRTTRSVCQRSSGARSCSAQRAPTSVAPTISVTAGCQPANASTASLTAHSSIHVLVGPLGDPDDGEEVDGAPAVDRVVQQVPAGARPELQRRRVGQRGHVLDGHEPAIADRARVPPAHRAGDVRADHRVHAVGADDHVGARRRTVREAAARARADAPRAHAAATEMQPFAAQPLAERLQQRDAVHAVVGRAERRLVARPPDRVVGDHLAGVPLRMTSADGTTDTASTCSPSPSRRSSRVPLADSATAAPISRSSSACSYTSQAIPRSRRASARTSPPIPPPTTATFSSASA